MAHPAEFDTDTAAPARGARLRGRSLLYFFGPAFVASIAYIDPGNFATNIDGGTRFGYRLLWVLLWSNAMAILVQFLSAKLGIVTGRTLPQSCRDNFPRPIVLGLWVAAEFSALATDLAEFLGAALGIYLLFGRQWMALGLSHTAVMLLAALLTAIAVFGILALEVYGFRSIELVTMVFVGIIGACYAIEVFLVHPNWALAAKYTLLPTLNQDSLYIAIGMLGATVMPHVVYLHSGLVQPRVREINEHATLIEQKQPRLRGTSRILHLRYELIDVLAAMNGAWLVNSAMIIMAAAVFASLPHPVTGIEDAYRTLTPLLGRFAAIVFAIALLASGLASSTVGTMAGQMILEGFLDVKFSIFLRRFLTLLPAVIVIAIGLDPLRILILSQVVLSFTLPFALVPLMVLTGRKKIMAGHTNGPVLKTLGWSTIVFIIALNGLLLWQLV